MIDQNIPWPPIHRASLRLLPPWTLDPSKDRKRPRQEDGHQLHMEKGNGLLALREKNRKKTDRTKMLTEEGEDISRTHKKESAKQSREKNNFK